jgi:macrolide transport system ATP-binding/permease protein
VSGRVQVVYGAQNANTQVEGVGVDYAPMRASVPIVGRFFTEEEARSRAKVAVLGTTAVKELFEDTNPIGATIKINLVNFTVIGILPPKGSASGGWRDQDDTIIVPVATAMYRLFGKEYVDSVYVEGESADVLDSLQSSITQTLSKRHHIVDSKDEAFQIRNMADIKSAVESTTKTMGMLLGSIAAISLLVGGIGIMNIMLVSVTERTKEIGLRKAIGATRRDIMMQFLVESVLMSCIGGAAGILLGCGISLMLTFFAGWAVKISVSSIVLATTFSLSIGMIFGLWPAYQASQLNPIEALRFE